MATSLRCHKVTSRRRRNGNLQKVKFMKVLDHPLKVLVSKWSAFPTDPDTNLRHEFGTILVNFKFIVYFTDNCQGQAALKLY